MLVITRYKIFLTFKSFLCKNVEISVYILIRAHFYNNL